MKLETLPEPDLDEAIFFGIKSSSPNIKQNNSHYKHKGAQVHSKHNVEVYNICLEKNEIKYGVNYSSRSNKHEITMLKTKLYHKQNRRLSY